MKRSGESGEHSTQVVCALAFRLARRFPRFQAETAWATTLGHTAVEDAGDDVMSSSRFTGGITVGGSASGRRLSFRVDSRGAASKERTAETIRDSQATLFDLVGEIACVSVAMEFGRKGSRAGFDFRSGVGPRANTMRIHVHCF